MNDGVEFDEDDRGRGPFAVRIGGTSDFVSAIDPDWPLAWPPGRVQTVNGWGRPEALTFDSLDAAIAAALQVGDIEGCHCSVEPVGR
jgi:hypothetical protein